MQRREILTTGAMGTLMGAVSLPAAGAQGSSSMADRSLERVATAIEDLRTQVRDDRQFTEIAPIRTAQKTFLRSNGKFPDFIDLGADVWFAAYDWHIRWQHPLVEARDAQGRLTLAMNRTQAVLRPDVPGNYVGLPYDAR